VLNYEKVNDGDVFFIPARRIHALGPGCMVAEIQQTSDTTYRVYDWDRLDQHGMYRELHIPQSLFTLNYKHEDNYRTEYERDKKDATVKMVECPYFTTNFINLEKGMALAKDYSELDSFVILMSVGGSFTLKYDGGEEIVYIGECILIPNIINKVEIKALEDCKILETYIV
jgi:mannose-6-phosphate isomerase